MCTYSYPLYYQDRDFRWTLVGYMDSFPVDGNNLSYRDLKGIFTVTAKTIITPYEYTGYIRFTAGNTYYLLLLQQSLF